MRKKYTQKATNSTYHIYGIHTCIAALENPKRKIDKILCNESIFKKYNSVMSKHNHEIVDNQDLLKIANSSQHQGILIKTSPLIQMRLEYLNYNKPNLKIAILDQITDPHNVGAIIRSASCFHIDAIITPKDNAVTENATIAKTACGALEQIPMIQVVNLRSCLQYLKKQGLWIVGFDCNRSDAKDNRKQTICSLKELPEKVFNGNDNTQMNIAMIFGSEEKGIRPIITKECDYLTSIPISLKTNSLNVSNASAIGFYAMTR
ncbi:MAG: 23S rRNA (guanosine(2251)-2'-O)-methyltransferase RlmB [Rickettsiaceae bacterium]